MEQLHEHNQRTYENICRMYDAGIRRVAVVQPTGSGKSLLMAKLIEDNSDSRFFILSTSHKINDQFKLKLDEGILERLNFNIYCNMPNMKQETMEGLQPDYILLDEMHRALAKEWSKGIKRLLEMYPDAKVLGLSATPIRYLDRCRNVVEELFNGNLACDMNLSQAILDGILPMARYVCGVYSFQKDAESLNKKIEKSCNSDEEKKELLKELKVLKENLDKANGVSDIFKKYIVNGNEKFVVFLKNTAHLREMKPVIEKWFIDAGFDVRMYEVHCKNADSDKEFQAFKEDTEDGIIKACLSVNMVAEGIHGDIDGVIMLRETISPNMYFQMIGRAFSCGKKTIPLIFDLVANSQFISDAVDNFPNELKGEIEKRKRECEKEGKDYEVGFDVDKFIVMDEFMDVVSGFRAIEERLIGDWDAMFKEYCKFYEKNGHGDVPKTEEYRKLKIWCERQRKYLYEKILNEKRKILLDEKEFIWDVPKYRFKKQVIEVKDFILKNGYYPQIDSNDKNESRLAYFVSRQRNKKRKETEENLYPCWKLEIIDKNLKDFFKETQSRFDIFCKNVLIFREEYGNVDIKQNDILENGYKIGSALSNIKTDYKNKKLSLDQIKYLEKIGIDVTQNKFDFLFERNMDLVKKAVVENVKIDKKHKLYKGVNLYDWHNDTLKRRIEKGELSVEELLIIRQLFSFNKKYIKMIDRNQRNYIYPSLTKVSEALLYDFGIIKTTGSGMAAIRNRLSGKVTIPYKGRFMFYYATDEEVKKYIEENKIS